MTLIQHRRGTAAQWADANPVLAAAEFGYERDTGVLKIGDGTTAYADLDPVGGDGPAGPVAWADLTGVPSTFPPATHGHAQGDVTGLTAALTGLDGRLDTLEAAPALPVTFVVDAEVEGLTLRFGRGPLPDPENAPNTIYFLLPESP